MRHDDGRRTCARGRRVAFCLAEVEGKLRRRTCDPGTRQALLPIGGVAVSIGEKRPNEAFAPLSDKQEFLEGCSTTVTTRRMGQNHLQIQITSRPRLEAKK